MRSRTRAAIAIWSSRATGARSERPFAVYLGLMIALVAIAPIARAVWLSASSDEGVAVLSSSSAASVAIAVTVCLWAGALLLGRERGPAIRPPFLTHALATSDVPVAEAFRSPLLRSGALVVSVCAGAAGLIGASLASAGLTPPLGIVSFAAVGALVGVITTVAWLAGQAMPRAAVLVAILVAALGAATVAFPALQAFTPWGWVGLAYPLDGVSLAPVALAALTVSLVTAVPSLMNRIGVTQLTAQAVRWSSATSHATGLDFDSAARTYQGKPQVARRLRAVRSGAGLAPTFLRRDAIGAIRTPGRFLAGILALVLAVVLVVVAVTPAAPGWLLGAAAGIIAYAALGPLTDGIRHAANVAADLPLYGISDEQVLAHHALFPLAVALIVVAAVIAVLWFIAGTFPAPAATSALLLVALALVDRIGNALKGPLPPVLLTPVPTAMGDPMAAVRLAWALDGLILAAVAGISSALAPTAPLLAAATVTVAVGTSISRWRHRR